MAAPATLSPATRKVLGTLIPVLAMLLVAGGWTIPFQFESFSILYKFGLEKTYLRSGKMVGITIVVLVFFQVVLASRFAFLEQIYSVKRLTFLHRFIGMTIGGLILLHPLLIKASESFTPYTFAKKYYPEFLGIALLVVLLALVSTAVFRSFFRFTYRNWLSMHRISATLAVFLLPAHILFVSETFKSGLPRSAALVLFTLILIMLTRIWLRRMLQKAG